MYMPSPYEAVLRMIVVAASDGRIADVAPKLFADDAVLHVPGANQLAGDHQGPVAIAEKFFVRQRDIAGPSLKFEPLQMDVRGTRGVLAMKVTATREGKAFEDRQVGVFKLAEGKITEGWIESSDQDLFDEFYS